MTTPMSTEDRQLDAQWRDVFGQPLPILGAGELVRRILAQASSAAVAEGSSPND